MHHYHQIQQITGNSSSNLLASSLVSNSPPLSARTSSTSNSNQNTSSHIINNPFLNTIMAGQQNSSATNPNQHTHEKGFKTVKIDYFKLNIFFLITSLFVFRESGSKNSGTSSSSNRSTPIQQTVPVPIALTIPSSSSSSSGTTNNVVNQQQTSPLLSSIDAAAAAMRQQASPLQQFLGPGLSYLFHSISFHSIYKSYLDSVVPFRNVYDAS